VTRRLRDEDLAASAKRADARRPVDRQADVAVLRDRGLTRVDADSDAELLAVRPFVRHECALGSDGSQDRIPGPRERDEERVALGIDLLAAVRRKRIAKELLMLGEDSAVAVAEALQQLRRSLDVGEEERRRSGHLLGHRHAR